MTNSIGIFIFRRDLRLNDNIGLLKLKNEVDIIIPIFILDKKQVKKNKHNKHYFSSNAVQFMCESLIDLNNQLLKFDSYLRIYYGQPKKIIKKLIKWVKNKFGNNIFVGYNADYSPYALKRDNEINIICQKENVHQIMETNDYTLISKQQLIKSDGNGFKQFGAFYKNAIKHVVNKPIKNTFNSYLSYKIKTKSEYDIQRLDAFYEHNLNLKQNGGRKLAIKKLNRISQFKSYNDNRNTLSYETTNLSAYLNFGCISIREAYHMFKQELGLKNDLIKQLYWRDFYLMAVRTLPDGNKYVHMDKRYERIKWEKKNKEKYWKLLIERKTGFLLIDAAMNEMMTTGFMHNRARMIVGTFWTKYLRINIFDPIYGSQVGYSKYLVDAIGPSQNKMNHQWITEFDYPGKKYAPSNAPIAGRPMDPSNRMIRKWDPDCIYIKKWIPQLKNVPNRDIYNWNDNIAQKYKLHHAPIFDHKTKYIEWINSCKI
jgi:deoxyribodipyrimidine photo-lyase